MAKAQKLIKCEIKWRIGRWSCHELVNGKWVEMYYSGVITPETKVQFIKRVAEHLNDRIGNGAVGFSVKIKGRDGKVLSERTYPRSADPKRSKG